MISGLIQKYLKLKSLRFAVEDIMIQTLYFCWWNVRSVSNFPCENPFVVALKTPRLDGFHSHLLCHRVVGQALDRP